uniref:Uncharacterized protein n=1 Tax=Lepeophtheirus salmonis TaxID=72036 RepID=A0A0K2TT86_LEPSM
MEISNQAVSNVTGIPIRTVQNIFWRLLIYYASSRAKKSTKNVRTSEFIQKVLTLIDDDPASAPLLRS